MHDLGTEMARRHGAGREDRDPALERRRRPQAQLEEERSFLLGQLVAHRQDEVADERAVPVETGEVVRDEDARRRGDRRYRGSAAVEDDDVRLERGGDAGSFEHVGGERRTRHASARPAATDRRSSGERGELQVIGRRVPPGAGQCQQVVEGRRSGDELRLRRSSPPHRDDDDLTVAREQPREMSGDRGLPDPLTGPDHGDRRQVERMERRWIEPEVGSDVRHPQGEEARREREPGLRVEHRLVREVDDDRRVAGLLDDRDAVVGRLTQLLRAADQDHADELVRQLGKRVAHDVRVVLSVDDRDRLHRLDVTSPSIRAVYFS